MSALAPTNHCDDVGDAHNVPPAQLPERLCQTTGVLPSELNNKESFITGRRKTLTISVLVLRFCNLWKGVFFDDKEICEANPESVGGQTTAG
jgi:hypothetical protein